MTKKNESKKVFDLKITRESLNGKDFKEIQAEMADSVADYTAKLATMNKKQLDEQEELLMEVFKANDERMKDVAYAPDENGASYDGIDVKANDIEKYIVSFLNRLEVEWQASLGIYQAIRFWKTRQKDGKIPYAVFDSTLRLLGTLKFKGEQDCFQILVINNWMTTMHKEYLADTGYLQYLSSLHQAIMDAQSKLKAPTDKSK